VTRKRFLIGLAIVVAATPFLLGFVWAVREARRCAVESKQRSLMSQAEWQLAEYHQQHGRYPDTLDGLNFIYSDGGDASTLATLKYQTDDSYYRIVAKSVWDGTEISVCH
jgi:hypothetical protein